MNDQHTSVTVGAMDARTLETLESEGLSAIQGAASVDELDDARVRYLGRKSELKQALREVRDRESGMALNAVRERSRERSGAAFRARPRRARPPAHRRADRRHTAGRAPGRAVTST